MGVQYGVDVGWTCSNLPNFHNYGVHNKEGICCSSKLHVLSVNFIFYIIPETYEAKN